MYMYMFVHSTHITCVHVYVHVAIVCMYRDRYMYIRVHHSVYYHMAGNIGGEFNLAVWRMSGRSGKFKSAKYSANGDLAPGCSTRPRPRQDRGSRSAKLKSANLKKMMNPSQYYSRQHFWPYGSC